MYVCTGIGSYNVTMNIAFSSMCHSCWLTNVNQDIPVVAVTEMYIAQLQKQNQILGIMIFLTMAQH